MSKINLYCKHKVIKPRDLKDNFSSRFSAFASLRSRKYFWMCFFFPLVISGCTNYTPKPREYFRIDFPVKKYMTFDDPSYPYSFEYPNIAKIMPKKDNSNPFWIDIVYPGFKARIYGSYKEIKNNNFREVSEDSRTFVYKHLVKADGGITEQAYENPDRKVYGILYEINGNTASNIQFVLTDSTHHFFRGALYFNAVPNKDSIAPVEAYIREDILRLIETMRWKEPQKN